MKIRSVKYLTIVVIIYMLAALTWWTVLLIRFNNENYSLSKEIGKEASSTIMEKHAKKKKMIIGEGVVFGITLGIGIFLLYKSYKEEVEITKRQNNFLLSVTHELKTPLSVMKLTNQTLSAHNLPREKQIDLLKSEEEEILRLESSINNILLATNLEKTKHLSKQDLSALIKRRASIFNDRLPSRIDVQIQDNIYLMMDENLFATAVDNIIDNAIKYSEDKISVLVKRDAKHIQIQIADTGKGIAEKEKKKVFEKFYRIGDEETRTSKGTGLGLYLSKTIVESHGGKVYVENNIPKGSIFTIEIANSVA